MRRLAIFAVSFSVAIFLASYFVPMERLLLCAVVCTIMCVAIGVFGGVFGDDRRILIFLVMAGAAFGFVRHYVFCRLVLLPSEELTASELRVSARVIGYVEYGKNNSSVELLLTHEDLPRIRFELVAYGTPLPDLEPGEIIEVDVKFASATRRRGENVRYYTSRGLFQTAYLNGELETAGKWDYSFLYFPQYAAKSVKEVIARDYPEDISHLMTALLMGDKTQLRDDIELDAAMGRAGISHIVSVSGMHVAYLVGFVQRFTGRKKRATLICIPIILFFIPMAGGSPSLIRAGFMQIALIIAPLFNREADAPTSLSVVLAIILFANPESAGNVGLQLSFAAMAGIMLVSGSIHDWILRAARDNAKDGVIARILRFTAGNVSGTIGATVLSTPLVAMYFGYVSLIAPVTNLLTLGVFSLVFTVGFVSCAISAILPALGGILGWVIAWPLRYVVLVIKLLAQLDNAAVYTSNVYIAWWLALTYAIFILSYALRDKKARFKPLTPAGISVSTLCLIILLTSIINNQGDGKVTVLDTGQGQCIIVMSGTGTVAVDCGGNTDAGNRAYEYLEGQKRERIDLLVLTHLHADHSNGTAELITRADVRRLAMPSDVEDPDNVLPDIIKAASRRGTEIFYISHNTDIEIGSLFLRLYAPFHGSSVNERGIVIYGQMESFGFLITGDIDSNTERELIRSDTLPIVDLLMVGHHGSKYSTSEELLNAVRPTVAAISSGYNNYGHPTGETLRRIADFGCDIYRTDLSGNIQFNVRSGGG